ncbi:YCII-related domain-containing protein [Pseudoxanthobacter soli DSM 19599]|uniref:YCII-related domain-containing protein n=1 Tax=Pseudoxanthobacter soli DSM 19599 TaxID=1123029 RepID=A0A1M7ZM58_9HYPH|nr:YciI family protein [Pseudoxanthobacter soli]SHO65899.1 YCII-related domain-containing protein [Pseudoxanthobacter soli DSM 19599]
MFFITLRFADKARAPQFMDAHNAWLRRGFDDGVFLVAGSLLPGAGGAILAHNASADEIETRVQADPFVAEGVVSAEIVAIAPGRTDERLAFLKA